MSAPSHSTTALAPHLDVLVIGAGISGIDAAYHLKNVCPDLTFAVLDAHESFGGTWLIHTYPGVRSDTEVYTLGFPFKPWRGVPYADGSDILNYLGETIEEFSLGDSFFYGRRVDSAAWSSDDQRWTVSGINLVDESSFTVTANFLWSCHGYYRHESGYVPEWAGLSSFTGQVVHPQNWPDDIDLRDKKVVVIGSGATMATLVPAIADRCEHVTVIQRSPAYFFKSPNLDPLADQLRELQIPDEWIHEIIRRKAMAEMKNLTDVQLLHPDISKSVMINQVAAQLPEGYDVATHFTPRHAPYEQRIARILDGDLFQKISDGKVTMVTDTIESFSETSIRTHDGQVIEADVVISATGFNLSVMGDVAFSVDGATVDFSNAVTYRGVMFANLPNLAWTFGALRVSWTMRADLVNQYVTRLLSYMKDHHHAVVLPQLRSVDESMEVRPFMDPKEFNPGYAERSRHLMPRSGSHEPWRMSLDFWSERDDLASASFSDGCLTFLD